MDLRRVVGHFRAPALEGIAAGDRAVLAELEPFGRAQDFEALSDRSRDALWIAAMNLEDGRAAALAAVAVLLIDALESGTLDKDLLWIWEAGEPVFRTVLPEVRAGLVNGFRHLRHLEWEGRSVRPKVADFLTRGLGEVEALLIPVARSMTADAIEAVSHADYGDEARRHKEALEEVLASETLAFPKDDPTFPREVVSLVSHVPGDFGHVPCLALVVLDSMRNSDVRDSSEFRYEKQWADIRGMPEQVSGPLFAGFRYLYESVEYWEPGLQAAKKGDVSIPWIGR